MRKNLLATTGIVVTLGLLLTGCTVGDTDSQQNNNSTVSSFEDDGCTHITIATSSEKINLMEEMATAFKESPEAKNLSECVTVKPINVTSGDGTTILSANPSKWPLENKEYWPTLWSPASTIWTNRVAAAGNENLVADAASFTRTPVVFGMPESMTKALDYPNTPISLTQIKDLIADENGWGSVGKPLWGSFKISKTNPNTSTTGLSVILTQSYAAQGKTADLTADDVQNSADFSRVFESGAIHYGDTTGKVLSTLYNETQSGKTNSGYVSAIAVEETSLINYNLGNPDSHTVQPGETLTPPKEKLVAVYPSDGSMWSDNPVTVLDSPWVDATKKEAGTAFAAFLQTKAAQEILPAYGFRPLNTDVELGKLFTADYGVDTTQPTVSLPQPEANVVSAAIDQWEQIRKPSAVLELVDISTSMNEGTGDGRSKLEGAVQGVKSTVSHFRSGDEVGVWAFTSGISSELGENVVPVREFGPLGTQEGQLKSAVDDLLNSKTGGTPLYDSVGIAYDYMQDHAEAGRINAIVVLTDGADEGSISSLESLLIKINSTKSEAGSDSQVRIFPIAYGEGANKEILAQIAKASGGQMFDATDATKIDTVFASVINNF